MSTSPGFICFRVRIGASAATGLKFSEGDPVTVGRKTCEVSYRPQPPQVVFNPHRLDQIESILDERDYMDGSVFLKQPLVAQKTISSISASSFFQPVVKGKSISFANILTAETHDHHTQPLSRTIRILSMGVKVEREKPRRLCMIRMQKERL